MTNLLRTAVIVVMLASGCSGVRVATDYDRSVDLHALKTYAWATPRRQPTGDPRLDNPLLEARIERAIESAMNTQGLRPADPGDADFLVAYHVVIDQRSDVTEVPTGFGYRGFWGGFYGSRVQVDQYEVGTLLIDFIERASDRLVWRGSGEARLHDRGSPEDRDARAQRTVDAILERFPPKR
jgi:hypothetical protein